MRTWIFSLPFWISTFLAYAEPSAQPSIKPLVEKMQKYYENTRDLHASFEQKLETGLGKTKKASGEVWLKRPGKMRWDYSKPEKKLMIADGKTLWVYEEEDQQAFRQDLKNSNLPAQVSFLLGQSRLSEEFEISPTQIAGVGQLGEAVIRLIPKAPTATYRYLVFIVDETSGQVKETIIYDQSGGQSRIAFAKIEQNRGVIDAKFTFSPPANVRVLTPPAR